MAKFAYKLLFLLSVLLMPLGMQGQAQAAAHHPTTAEMQSQHCPDQPANHGANGGFAECTMACAAALPAINAPQPARLTLICLPPLAVGHTGLEGLHLEIATPPPKAS